MILLIGSVFFYSWGAPKFVFVILCSTILDFFIVKKMDALVEGFQRKLLLISSISINLGLLMYFKYANFFIENTNRIISVLGITQINWTSVVLPIGISFYTFQTLTYAIDVYRKEHKPLVNLTDYLLYILSFPQMIAGPIVRFKSVAKQIVDRKEYLDDKLMGFYRFSIGLAKKVLIANVMAEQADLIFDGNYSDLSMSMAWLGALAYTFQIYFDFSGYSDMAIGLGKIMGFKFPENFDSPYVSRSITEFWRRWHITLGNFMKDYLYIPLGGNRVSSKYRLFFNLWFVFLLSGLWHGASWNYIIWGVYHGFFLILERIFLLKVLEKMGKMLSIIFTFFVVVIGWVIFRIESLEGVVIYFKKLLPVNEIISTLDVIPSFWFFSILALIFSLMTLFKIGRRIEYYFLYQENHNIYSHFYLTMFSILLFILSVSSITSSDFNPFIYFRF